MVNTTPAVLGPSTTSASVQIGPGYDDAPTAAVSLGREIAGAHVDHVHAIADPNLLRQLAEDLVEAADLIEGALLSALADDEEPKPRPKKAVHFS